MIDDSYTDHFFDFSSSINEIKETSNFQNRTNQANNFTNDLIIKGNNEEVYQVILDNVLKNYDISNGKEMVYKGEDNFFFHLTNTENELEHLKGKNNNTNKFSIIDLGECGNLLKRHYKINQNISLLIMKYEKVSNISSERSLQYEVYEPYNKTKLNLSICSNVSINIYIPVVLSEKTQNLYNELKDLGYDLFDINSPFYQDICTPYKSSDGTDVLLSDRINTYYNNEETSCQSNCKFSDFLMETQYLKCDCDIENSQIDTQKAESFSAKSIYQSSFSVLKYSNYKVLKCGKLTFNINSITKNIGSILTMIYFLIYSIFLSIYCFKGISQLKTDFSKNIFEKSKNNQFSKVIDLKEKSNLNIHNINEKKQEDLVDINNVKLMQSNNNNKKSLHLNHKYTKNIQIKINKRNSQIYKKVNKTRNIQCVKFTYPPKMDLIIFKNMEIDSKYKINISKSKFVFINNNIITMKKDDPSNSDNKKKNEEVHINKQIFDVLKFDKSEKEKLDDYQLNNLEFDLAQTLDKRNFLEIYWSLLKREHLIIFTFITRDDHNIMFVKYSRFIFLLCTDMAMNVFFFSDDTMHKMFLDYGKYNFIQQIPQIIYSTIISQLIEIFLCYLSLTDKHFYQVKECKKVSKQSMLGIMKCIQIKICFFFVFTSLMFIFYWYLVTCFCAVYQNTQISFIKDSLLSFVLSISIPFGLYLIPSFLRIIALKVKKYKLEFVYKASGVIPFF